VGSEAAAMALFAAAANIAIRDSFAFDAVGFVGLVPLRVKIFHSCIRILVAAPQEYVNTDSTHSGPPYSGQIYVIRIRVAAP